MIGRRLSPLKFIYVNGFTRSTLLPPMRPLPTIALNLCWFILILFASAIRSIAMYPTLCLVPLYWSVGFPNPTITFILCSFPDFISSVFVFSWFCSVCSFCFSFCFSSCFSFCFCLCLSNCSCIFTFCCCFFLCFLRSDSQELTAASASCVAHFSGSFPFCPLPEALSNIFWLMLSGFFFLRCFGRYWFHSS